MAAGALAGLPAPAVATPDRLASLRRPGDVPDPRRPPGTPDPRIPIDHVVVVMMENHSFDNYLGMLPRSGRPGADGFRFDHLGRPRNANPVPGGVIRSFRMPSECQMESEPSQAWNATHQAVAGGAMTGFVAASGDVAMGYWDEPDIPFYYSLARTFPLANRWFASCPAQTYPNRRFLFAGTAYGLIRTVTPGPNDPPPPNGTIFDRLDRYGLSWTNYFTDLPQTAIIPSVVKANPTHLAPVSQFYSDAATGRLPAFALVDPDFGGLDAAGGQVPGQPLPQKVRAQGQDEENPQNIRFGEAFVADVVDAVMRSPAWPRTLVVWVYDEHGGYYDHVSPPAAVRPDRIPPDLQPGDAPGGYDVYGVRVPAVVVSPWARPGYVSPVVHDHTSILRFVETKWNLPALTYRDANASDLLDFLDLRKPHFAEPPLLAAPADALAADRSCTTDDPHRPVQRG
ncbi:MAG TPA: alkaline phosphatase family protein [Acidimicrobiales bacterium]|nr:alkaline phosphatase family protein [Acidimicrobiales bacterium]